MLDTPIAASTLVMLDSRHVEWTAAVSGGAPNGCSYTSDADWLPSASLAALSGVATAGECCALCWSETLCAASVFVGSDKTCFLKEDLTGGSIARPQHVSCVKKRGAAPSLVIKAQVPGDLLTDLERAGQIGNPLYEKNFLNDTLYQQHNWTYATHFGLPDAHLSTGGRIQLVFDGIKMGARIAVNGVPVGLANDQFARYRFQLFTQKHKLLRGAKANVLTVEFDPTIDCGGRFMACTGGWDWAPYTHTYQRGARIMSKGIWKGVYLAIDQPGGVAISHVVPQITYRGSYPTRALVDGAHAGFAVGVRVHLSAGLPTKGTLSLTPGWSVAGRQPGALAVSVAVDLPEGESNVTLHADADARAIKLWWAAGMGSQPLYNLTVSFSPEGSADAAPPVVVRALRRVGFRYFALVTGNDTDPAYVKEAASAEGTVSHGMYWRLNGAPVYAKGANMIPMEELEGRMSAEAHRRLVRSAAEGAFNTLRVWGGGMFLPDAWYDAADELGLMVYHDMQYAQAGHSPKAEPIQEAELRHVVRRLSAHPSIVIWDGCNECRVVMGSSTAVYASFVMTVVAQEDSSRAVWPSCPALGWTGGVRRLDATPTGKPLTTPPSGTAIETHGYYQHGGGFPAVNGGRSLNPFDPEMPLKLTPTPTGIHLPNVFASEFGAVVFSSFESMAPTLDPKHWSLHAGQPYDNCTGGFESLCRGENVMAERNYPGDNMIVSYFGPKADAYFNSSGERVFKKQLYQSMLSQALNVKAMIESRRARNELGVLVWQYNEIWPTGGWGSVEYGTPVEGQVIGGRWKPLQYMYKRSVFQDVMAVCGAGGQCYVRNDLPGRAFDGVVEISALEIASGGKRVLAKLQASLPAGPGATYFFNVNLTEISSATHILTALCHAPTGAPSGPAAVTAVGAAGVDGVYSFNELPLAPPSALALPTATVTATAATSPNSDGSVNISVRTDRTALYVTLTTLANGRFSDNAFALTGSAVLKFIPFGLLNLSQLTKSLRVEHLQQNL
uniref:beta-mannosidase n=1 Tax=Calcidiscus leptoporus TaxID=127549 RepID=A0A7S0IZA9_9EUKA